MPSGDDAQLPLTLRESDVETRLAATDALQKVLQGQCRLPCAGPTLDEVDPIGVKTAVEEVVETGNTSRDPLGLRERQRRLTGRRRGHGNPHTLRDDPVVPLLIRNK